MKRIDESINSGKGFGTIRLFTIFILFMLLCAFFFIATDKVVAETSGDFDYQLINGDSEVEIMGYHGSGGNVVIPGMIDAKPVTSIGNNALSQCTSLISVTIPNSVNNIGNNAFFSCTSLTAVTIGSGVTTIGDDAFSRCTSLTNVTIPNNVTSIGVRAFSSCASLTSIDVDAANANYASVDGVLYNKAITYLIQCPGGKVGAIIPNSVTTIGAGAFSRCTSLTTVTIGIGVTLIGTGTFYQCTSLTSIDVDAANAFYASVDGVLYNKAITTLIKCPGGKVGAITIPNSVTSIEDNAFYQCTTLTSIDVDAANAFYASVDGVLYNKAITTLIKCPGGKNAVNSIPNSVTSIGNSAFSDCISLTTVTLGSGVNTIGDEAFYQCTNLTSVTIGSGVNNIGNYAFTGCTSLTSLTFLGLVAPTTIEENWILGLDTGIMGHANGASNFPSPGGVFHGLTMGTVISAVPPGVPTNFLTTPSNTQVTLTWQAPAINGGSAITGYKVYQSTTQTGTYSLIASPSGLNYTNTGLTNGQTYWYKVSAVNAQGEGAASNIANGTTPVATVPDEPQGMGAAPCADNVTVSWQVPVSDGGSAITGYKVLRGSNVTDLVVIGNTSVTTLNYIDEDVVAGQTYYYAVIAVNNIGNSAVPEPVSAVPKESGDGSSDSTWLYVGIGVAAVAIIGGAAFFLTRRKM
jgi:hypothetical protein